MSEPELPLPDANSDLSQNPFAERGDDPRMPLAVSPGLATQGNPDSQVGQGAIATVIILLLAFAIVNCAAVPFIEGFDGGPYSGAEFVLAIGLGIIGGQIGSLSSVIVWSNFPFLRRLFVLWAVALLLFGFWFAGLAASYPDNDWMTEMMYDAAPSIAASLPLISLAVQLPQWVMRLYFNWRIERSTASAAAQPREALSIRDIMIGTAIAAVTLTAVRFAVTDGDEVRTDFWIAWAMATGVLLVVSAVVTIPLVLLILRAKNLVGAVLFHLLGPPVLVAILIGVTMLFERSGPEPRAVVLMMLAVATCIAVSSAPFWLYRLTGHRLKIGRPS